MRLENKVAIITGAGSGIGRATALRFVEEGAQVALVDINADSVKETLELTKAGKNGTAIVADISREADAQRIAEETVKAFGRINILVNNAASFLQKNIMDASPEDWQQVLGVNVIGTSMVTRAVVPHLKRQGGGSIVNLASISGLIAQKDFATYNASKGALITLTKCMALDFAPFGIRVNCICPAAIHTPASHIEIKRLGMTFEQWRDIAAPLHLLNRLGEPREVANAILFLASDEASFITGAPLLVDGGYTAR